jgi:hypothetical protein
MRSADSHAAFDGFLRDRGLAVASLDAFAAVDAMIEFYVTRRAEDTNLTRDGDMLLFQWGTYDWGNGPSFRYDITRQFIAGLGDDEDFWQLSLTLHYEPSDATQALGSGNRWCSVPDDAEDFKAFIREHPSSDYAASATPQRVELDLEPAG